MIIAILFDILLIGSVALWLIKLAIDGAISIEMAAGALLGLAALRAITRAIGFSFGRFLFTVLLPIAGILVFIIWYGGGDIGQMSSIFGSLATLMIAVVGVYIMVFGVARTFRKKD